jgi:hypothetical protein
MMKGHCGCGERRAAKSLRERVRSSMELLVERARRFASSIMTSVATSVRRSGSEKFDLCHDGRVQTASMPPDYEECGECGFDHEYEYEAAHAEHLRLGHE